MLRGFIVWFGGVYCISSLSLNNLSAAKIYIVYTKIMYETHIECNKDLSLSFEFEDKYLKEAF